MPVRSAHNIAFGLALRQLRTEHEPPYTQAELALIAGLDRTYISMLELGDRSPTLTTIIALSEALEVSPEVLFGRAMERYRQLNESTE